MLIRYIQTLLAQAAGALDRYLLTLVLDRSNVHNIDQIMEAFHDNGCQDLVQVVKMPTQAAKRMSPLDNALFHEWKDNVRKRGPLKESNIEQGMADEWNNIPIEHIYNYYRHCGLTSRTHPYSDCPLPAVHKH